MSRDLATRLTRAIFEIGDGPGDQCRRIAFKGGSLSLNAETDLGGMCELAMSEFIRKRLVDIKLPPQDRLKAAQLEVEAAQKAVDAENATVDVYVLREVLTGRVWAGDVYEGGGRHEYLGKITIKLSELEK